MSYLGDYPVGATVDVYLNTFDGDGASVTITGLAVTDIEVYKNGVATARASDSGYTLLDTDGIDFDSITGIHGFSIDTSDNSDAGFFAAGNEYAVIVSSITVDAQTVNFVAATFSIERAGGALALLKNATYGLSALEGLVDDLESRLSAARAGYLDVLQYLPSIAAGAAGGLFIAGTNAATTVTTALTTTFTGNLTGNVGGNVTGTIGGLALAAKAEVQTEAEDALKAYDLDHLIQVTAGSEEPTVGSYLDQIMNKDASQTFDQATDSLEVISGASGLTPAQVRTQVDNALIAIDLDHLIQVTAGAEEPTDGSYLDQIMHKDASQTFNSSTDSLEALGETLDQASITVVSAISGDTLSIIIGATYEATVSGLTISATWTKVYFTIKSEKESQIDSTSIVQIVETNPAAGTDGLLYFNGATGTAGNAALTVDQAAGTVAIKILDEATDDLTEAQGLEWDIKVLEADGDSAIVAQGACDVNWTPTRAVA